MFSTQHAKHAAPRQTDKRRLVQRATIMAASAALIAPTLGVGTSSASTHSLEPDAIPLPDGTPTYLYFAIDRDSDGTPETVVERHIEGRQGQSLKLGLQASLTSVPDVQIGDRCRSVTARLEDGAFSFIADHTYQVTQQDGADGVVAVGEPRTDSYGQSGGIDTPNPSVTYKFCR